VIGLPFVSASRITSSAFYAVQDAKKPVLAANLSVLANVLMGVALLFPLQHRGLALSVSVGSITNFLLLMYFYRKKIGPLGLKKMAFNLGKISFAGGVMGSALFWIQRHWDWTFAPFWPRAGYLAALLSAGMLIYLGLVLVLKVEGLRSLFEIFTRRLKIRGPGKA
jgi:putative peptidoglycan lipid II flippase